MEKLETTKEFVMSAHQAACKDLKQRIEEEFPSLFEVKLEVGKWYKNLTWEGSYMLYSGERDKDVFECIGITFGGNWLNNGNWGVDEKYRLATPTEVESMLWKEAEKRGIGKDTKLECHSDGSLCSGIENYAGYEYGHKHDELWNKYGCVYSRGSWAKPLDSNKEIKETIERLGKELKELKEKVK